MSSVAWEGEGLSDVFACCSARCPSSLGRAVYTIPRLCFWLRSIESNRLAREVIALARMNNVNFDSTSKPYFRAVKASFVTLNSGLCFSLIHLYY